MDFALEQYHSAKDLLIFELRKFNPIVLVSSTIVATYVLTNLRHMHLDEMGESETFFSDYS